MNRNMPTRHTRRLGGQDDQQDQDERPVTDDAGVDQGEPDVDLPIAACGESPGVDSGAEEDAMTITRRTLAQWADAVEAAPDLYKAAMAALTRPDGSRVYAEREHRERQDAAWLAWRQTLQGAADAANEAAGDAASEIARVAGALVGSAALERLTTGEIQRAGALDPFLREDFDALSPVALAARVEEAVATGDRVAQLLYYRHGQRLLARLEGERSGPLVVENGRPIPPGSAMTGDERRLAAATDSLAARLVGPADASRRASAEARLGEANDLAAMVTMAEYMFSTYAPRPTGPVWSR